MRSRPDLTGKRFNRLVALRPDPEDARYWETQCDCGNTKRVRGEDQLSLGDIRRTDAKYKQDSTANEWRCHRAHAAIVGIDQDTIQMRLRRGWSEVRALTQPPRTSRQRSKLSDDDVREIRKLRADGARPVDLARRFGVKAQTIVQIQKRQVFASLTDREGK